MRSKQKKIIRITKDLESASKHCMNDQKLTKKEVKSIRKSNVILKEELDKNLVKFFAFFQGNLGKYRKLTKDIDEHQF